MRVPRRIVRKFAEDFIAQLFVEPTCLEAECVKPCANTSALSCLRVLSERTVYTNDYLTYDKLAANARIHTSHHQPLAKGVCHG